MIQLINRKPICAVVVPVRSFQLNPEVVLSCSAPIFRRLFSLPERGCRLILIKPLIKLSSCRQPHTHSVLTSAEVNVVQFMKGAKKDPNQDPGTLRGDLGHFFPCHPGPFNLDLCHSGPQDSSQALVGLTSFCTLKL